MISSHAVRLRLHRDFDRAGGMSRWGQCAGLLAMTLSVACAGSNAVGPTEPVPVTEAAPGAAAPGGVGAEETGAPAAEVIAPELASSREARAVPPSPSSGCRRTTPSLVGGTRTAHAGKLQTPYSLTLPDAYDGKQPVPLVFAFHGRTRSHQSMHDGDASRLAEELGGRYAVAYVKSIGPGFDQPKEQRDNLPIFDALYAELLANYCIDTEQVFALGHSSGGLFSELLSCERAPLLRGIAAVAGAMVWPACPGRTAALLVHGEHDAVVSVSRGRAARERFLAANGCSNESATVGAAGCSLYAGCDPARPVEWCEHSEPTYQNTNHGWPSFASGEVARFFGTLGRVPHAAGEPLLGNESFDAGSEPWQVAFAGSAKGKSVASQGALCTTLELAGENPWDAQVTYPGLKPEPGRQYVIDYRLWSSAPTDVRVKVGLDAAPFNEYWQESVAADVEPRRIRDHFVLSERAPGTLAIGFQFAGSYARKVPVTVCIDEVSVTASNP